MVVLFSVSEGRPIVLRDAILYLDNVPVLKYPFSVAQMQVLMRRGVHRLFDARIPAGKHSIRLELKAVQGTLPPMATYAFTKGRSAKFIEFQLYGEAPRKIDVIEW